MFQSKLGNYPMAGPKEWIAGAWESLDPKFAGRIAFLGKSKGVKVQLTEGYRSTARQTELYNLYLQYKKTGKGTIKSAARPGTSWHEIRLAVDTSTQPIRGMSNIELAPYGLCKPLRKEGWHIQPIETLKMGTRAIKSLAPIEMEEDLTKEETLALIKEVLNGKDTQPSAWAKEPWAEATKQGVVDGTRPQGVVTRQELAKVILNK